MHDFNADVSKVLRLVIHSIYTNKDIFIRELISNASDACEKARYLIATGECEGEGDEQSKIEVILNKKDKYVSVKDNGIGTQIHYPIPPYVAECYAEWGYRWSDFPVAEKIANQEVSLPIYCGIPDEELKYVIDVINKY